MRIYLTGRMAVEAEGQILDESAFPGRQGRLAFAFLALSAQRPVARDALADSIWNDALPASWDSALKSLVSKLRTVLAAAGLPTDTITTVSGCHQLRLPVGAWVDLEASARAIDVAEAALARDEIDRAWSEATVTTAIARRAFLPGEDAPWIDDVRRSLRSRHVRALETLAQVWLAREKAPLAVASASEAIGLEPYRESGYRLLMRAHSLAGNRAEAIRTYERCAGTLADELGVDPDPETTALRARLQSARPARGQTMTIAVTDIVGSTDLSARLGDEQWSKVLARHDRIVRDHVDMAGGHVLKHLGDGFLTAFASSGAALTGLRAAQAAVGADDAEPAIAIRIGIHAGEPVEQGDDVFGLQVNIAARISALAGANEILVSSVVRDLSPPGQFRFGEPRSVELKGVPGEIILYRVE